MAHDESSRLTPEEKDPYRLRTVGTRVEIRFTAEALGPGEEADQLPPFPLARGDCPPETWAGAPCHHVRCRHHLAIEDKSDTVKIVPGLIMTPWNCALALVNEAPEGMTLEQIGGTLHLTRERVRQIETSALERLRETELGQELLADLGTVKYLQPSPQRRSGDRDDGDEMPMTTAQQADSTAVTKPRKKLNLKRAKLKKTTAADPAVPAAKKRKRIVVKKPVADSPPPATEGLSEEAAPTADALPAKAKKKTGWL